MTGTEWPCTAEEIIKERDEKSQSWKEVAVALGLGLGKKNRGRYAQHAYEELTGLSRHDSRPLGGRGRSKIGEGTTATRTAPSRPLRAFSVQWDDDSDQGEIEEQLLGARHQSDKGETYWACKRVTVRHNLYGHEWTEEIAVRYATAFTFGPEGDQPLQVSVMDNDGAIRTLFVAGIKKVK